jgi:hypothetical protein
MFRESGGGYKWQKLRKLFQEGNEVWRRLKEEIWKALKEWERFKSRPHVSRAMRTGIIGILLIMGPILLVAYPLTLPPQYSQEMREDIGGVTAVIIFYALFTVAIPILLSSFRKTFTVLEALISGIFRWALIWSVAVVRHFESGDPIYPSLALLEFPIMVGGYCLALKVVERVW